MFIICYTICSVIVKIPIFIKAKKSPWLATIPIISDFILLEICFNNNLLGWLVCFVIYAMLFSFLLTELVPMILKIFILMLLMFHMFTCLKLAKNFGKGKLFASGLFFLWPVFLLILAFDKSKYLPSENNDCYDNNIDNTAEDKQSEKNNLE